jgi:hypothetical protein
MNAVVVDSAVGGMRRIAEQSPQELSDLLAVIENMSKSSVTADGLAAMRVGSGPTGEVFLARSGTLRAVLTQDPAPPERLVVAEVYRVPLSGGPAGMLEAR